MMLDALIFDFDGVVVDSEPVHLRCFRAVLAKRGIDLATQDYYSKYLGFDDHDCFAAVMAANARQADENEIHVMIAEKTALVQEAFARDIKPLPGAVELMAQARGGGVAVAVCSGALRDEIRLAGRTVGAMQHVQVLVAAQDVRRGKPDPEGYLLALRLLGQKTGKAVRADHCWVLEDSPAGIAAAHAAGCRVLAITNSYPRAELKEADRVVASLAQVSLEQFGVK
jgi:beta-phosphoglucomutase